MTGPAASPPPPVARLEPGSVSPALVTALYTGVVLSRADAALLTLTGPGAVTCAQGLLTNDLEQAGDGAFVYGALLTPKGMIVVDAWAARLGTTVGFTVPGDGRDRALAIFTRSVPPRLARLQDVAEAAIYQLRGLLFDPEPPAAPARGWTAVMHLDREVGRVTSLAFVPESGVSGAGRWIGLAVIRREVAPGAMVRAAGRDARVVDLPFAFPVAAPA